MLRKTYRLSALLAAGAMLLAACGGDDTPAATTAGGGGQTTQAAKQLVPGPGFDGTTIKLGVITPLTGRAAGPIGIPLTEGTKVYWEKVNANGGVGGKYKVELVIEDNAYDPPTTVQKYSKIKNDVVAFTQILGTPPTNAVLPQLKSDNIVAAPASLDAEWVREAVLMPVGAPYQIQFINAAQHLMDSGFRGKNICIVAAEGPYGDAGIEGAEFAGKEFGFELKAKPRFKDSDQDFTAQVEALKAANCEAVFMTALPSNTGGIIGKGAQVGFTPQWVGQSPTWVTALAASPQLAPLLQQSFWLMGEGTTWGDTTSPGMKEMVDDVAKFRPQQQADQYFAFGYSQSKSFHALIEKAVKDGDLSREGVKKALATLGEVNMGGLLGNYTYAEPAQRKVPRRSTVYKINPAVPGAVERLASIESEAAKKFQVKVS